MNNNDGFYTTGEQEGTKHLDEVLGQLEILLKKIKSERNREKRREIAKTVREGVDKTADTLKQASTQIKKGVDKTNDAFKRIKERYNSIQPEKQKAIKFSLGSVLVTIIAVIGIAKCFEKENDK